MGRKKELPPPGLLGCGFAVTERNEHELLGILSVWLPGVELQQYRWMADKRAPEEVAAFYDDCTHSLRVETKLLMMAVEELTGVQLPLF